jgi:hypothetical protein
MWRLKRRSFIRYRDRNTSFFHKQARTLRNNVKELTLKVGSTILDFQGLKNASMNHFTNLFTEHDRVDPETTTTMLANISRLVSEATNVDLMKLIEEAKILNTI